MVRRREDIEVLIGEWAAEPALAPLLRAGAAAIVWDAGARPVWASEAAQGFAARLRLDDGGALDAAVPASARIRALAGGLAPRTGSRLEKLRFTPSALVPLATGACRLIALPSGEEVLLMSFVGALPALPAPPRPAAPVPDAPPAPVEPVSEAAAFLGQEPTAPPQDDALPVEAVPDLGLEAPDPAPEPIGAAHPERAEAPPVDPVDHLRGLGTVRFLWQADPQGRFLAVSEPLARIVGPASAAIVGWLWSDLRDVVEDPAGIVAEHLARGETWSGRTVLWRVAGTDHVVPVDLAGMPVRDRSGALQGFRGFGLIRTAGLVERPPAPLPVAPEPSEPQPMPVADSPIDEPAGAPDAEPVRAAVEAPHHEAAETPEPATIAEADVAPGQPEPEIVDEAPIEATEFQVADAPAHATPAAIDEAALAVEIAAADVAPEEAAHRAPEPVPGDGSADVVEAILDEPLEEGAPAAEHEHEHEPEPEPEPVALVEAPADAPPPDAANDDAPAEPPAFSDLSTRADGAFANAWSARVATDVDAPAAEPVEPAPEAAPATPAPEVAAPVTEAPPAPAPRPSPAASGAMLKLSAAERNAFREIARALGARFDDESEPEAVPEPAVEPPAPAAAPALPAVEPSATQVLARLPIGVLVHRGESLIYANRALLDMLGYDDAPGLIADGGLMRLFKGRAGLLARAEVDTPAPVPVVTRSGEAVPAEIRHVAVDWDDEPAALMLVRRVPDGDPAFRLKGVEADLRVREGRVRELSSILDTATDGVVVVDDVGRVLSLNRSAEALFGFEQNEVVGEPFTALIAPESHVAALDYLEGLRANGVASLLNDGREVLGRVRQGGVIPLFMTMGRVSDGLERKFCAVLRDITAFKKAEGELLAAKRAAEASSAHKSDFLAKISHEVRTPLNAIIGFAEVMLEERFGPVGNDRYRDYLRDIHASGEHVISLVNDLLDLAKVEAGRMEMAFTSVSLNELVTSCVSIMQPEAARARIVLRTSFSGKLPPVVADERSVRQIVLNLLSNAVKFTDAGGQVIVSTALTDRGEVAFRVRDTGIGMSDDEIEAALEPFRQLATARRGGGTGLGLPLTKALVEANRGMLQISSTKSEGTLVEVVFPPTRVLAE